MGTSKQYHIERSLGLNLGTLTQDNKSPELKAVIKTIETFPWIVEVAEFGYDEELAKLLLQREAINLMITKRREELRGSR